MADGTCTWNCDRDIGCIDPLYNPDYGTCVGETSVPAGCPIHVLVPRGATLDATPSVPAITVATSYVDTQSVAIAVTVCDAVTSAARTYDRVLVTVSGAQPGDAINFSSVGSVDALESFALIQTAGACPATTWPTDFEEHIESDGDDCSMPVAAHHGGCATAGDASWAMVAIVAIVVARCRR